MALYRQDCDYFGVPNSKKNFAGFRNQRNWSFDWKRQSDNFQKDRKAIFGIEIWRIVAKSVSAASCTPQDDMQSDKIGH